MSNDNIVPCLSGFGTGGPFGYRSPDIGDFGTVSLAGTFGAFCTCVVRGSYQTAAVPAQQYLWGNWDASSPNTGWMISIEDNAGQGAVTARVGRGADVVLLQADITGAGAPAFAMRAMQIGLFLTNEPVAYLTINGQIVAEGALATAFSPSAFPVAVGISPITPADAAATDVDIAAVGYTYNDEYANRGAVGDVAGLAFAAARAAFGCAPVDPDAGTDWVHRYSVRALAQNAVGSITKAPNSAKIRPDMFPNPFGYASAPSSWADEGNVLIPPDDVAVVPYAPIALTRIGPLFNGTYVAQPYIRGYKNLDWYGGGASTFA